MSTERAKGKKAKHVVRIDLPGEVGQCWLPNAEKVQVLLAKHMDVILDIQMFHGMQYEVEANQDFVYDKRTKQLIPPRNKIKFSDGEVLNLWIARNFKGQLKLTGAGRTLGTISPKEMGGVFQSDDPAVKPPPISVVIKNSHALPECRPFEIMQLDGSYTSASIESREAEKFLQIVEIDPHKIDIPREVAAFFEHGGEKEVFESGNVVTRNWIFNQVVSQSAYISDNKAWMSELWGKKITLKTVVHKNVGKKMYVILTGSTKVRKLLTASLYSAQNSKVLAFSFGSGSASGLRHAAWGAVRGNLENAGLYSLIFTATLDITEWMSDYEKIDPATGKPKQDFVDLFIKIGLDVAKNLINSAIVVGV